jgi:type IV secretory pathway VirB10-like protein
MYGQRRAAIIWTRLIMPNGGEIRSMNPKSILQRRQSKRRRRQPLDKIFGAAAFGTLINIGVAATEDPGSPSQASASLPATTPSRMRSATASSAASRSSPAASSTEAWQFRQPSRWWRERGFL